jgi:hypothetical protein
MLSGVEERGEVYFHNVILRDLIKGSVIIIAGIMFSPNLSLWLCFPTIFSGPFICPEKCQIKISHLIYSMYLECCNYMLPFSQ